MDEEEQPDLPVREVYVKVRSAVDRYFNFQIRKISTVLEPDAEHLAKVFPRRPVFFKKPPTYNHKKLSMNDYVTNENFYKDMDREITRTHF